MKTPDVLEWMAAEDRKIPCPVDRILFAPTGSAYTCDPPVNTTDEDWILWHETPEVLNQVLERFGYTLQGGGVNYSLAASYRKGNVNIIVIHDADVYKNWLKATAICKWLNLTQKSDRKAVHRICCEEGV